MSFNAVSSGLFSTAHTSVQLDLEESKSDDSAKRSYLGLWSAQLLTGLMSFESVVSTQFGSVNSMVDTLPVIDAGLKPLGDHLLTLASIALLLDLTAEDFDPALPVEKQDPDKYRFVVGEFCELTQRQTIDYEDLIQPLRHLYSRLVSMSFDFNKAYTLAKG